MKRKKNKKEKENEILQEALEQLTIGSKSPNMIMGVKG